MLYNRKLEHFPETPTHPHCNIVGQVGFHRTVPLVLHGTGGIGRTHRIEMLVGQVGFQRTVPLVLHGTGEIGRTHTFEGVGGTGRIPKDCPTYPT